jgi:hypothetical protein
MKNITFDEEHLFRRAGGEERLARQPSQTNRVFITRYLILPRWLDLLAFCCCFFFRSIITGFRFLFYFLTRTHTLLVVTEGMMVQDLVKNNYVDK